MKTPWPRLTETLKPAGTGCRNCGDALASLWQECDEDDRRTHCYLWLCKKCGDAIVEPHVRLYCQISDNSPAPGVMRICMGCEHSDGTRCNNPTAKINGGTGLTIKTSQPMVAMVDGTRNGRRTGWREVMYFHPPSHCNGRNPIV